MAIDARRHRRAVRWALRCNSKHCNKLISVVRKFNAGTRENNGVLRYRTYTMIFLVRVSRVKPNHTANEETACAHHLGAGRAV